MRQVFEGTIVGDEMVWKYFKPERFLSLLKDNQIYFASANQFGDPFEGAIAVHRTERQVDPSRGEMDRTERAFFELKRLTKISCWHCADYESDAMWKLYAGQNKGIAICSTPDRMQAAIRPYRLKHDYGPETLWGGPIRYVDLTQVRMRTATMLNRFFFKHRAFEWEREFRLAISLRTAEECGVAVPAEGILVDVDLPTMIDRIVIGSTTTEEVREVVTGHVVRAGLEDRLELSTLLGKPRFV